MIVFVTTADTEILAMSQVTQDLPDGFPALKTVTRHAYHPIWAPRPWSLGRLWYWCGSSVGDAPGEIFITWQHTVDVQAFRSWPGRVSNTPMRN
jgi:hypothetical protein